MSLCPFWPSYVPFQGVMLCKNGQKLLKINISCMFWPNSVWNFLMTSFYEICLVEHIFNILLPLFPILAPFRGSCCVKNGPNLFKINIFCMFWPNNVWKPFCIKLFYEMFLVCQIFNIFNCHCALFDQVMSPFRGSCCVKMAKTDSK